MQEALIARDPARYFRPPYVGHNGWVGTWLDDGIAWPEVEYLIDDAWRMTANKGLIRELDDVMGEYFSSDSTSKVRFNDYWGRWTQLGGHGDARTATAEKGAVILEAAVSKLVGIVDELRAWPIAERADMHERPVSKGIRQ